MKASDNLKAGILAITLVLLFLTGWELYWRGRGFENSYNDDESLWASTRNKIYTTSPAQPVIIGSSRVKFDIDQHVWQKASGLQPVQLALVGTSPRPVLRDLGNDPDFKGTVLIGITESLFFAKDHSPMEGEANKRIEYYPKWSLSQKISFYINQILESGLIFLDTNRFSLNSLLKRLPIESRPGVFVFPNFPLEMNLTLPNRQEVFTNTSLSDTSVRDGIRYVWNYLGMTNPNIKGVSGDTLTQIFADVKQSVGKIKARGGNVFFLRMPSTGPVWVAEQACYPRKLYWDRLLQETKTDGIHFTDYASLSKYTCPDWSHLTPGDARIFTNDLIKVLEEKTGWTIKNPSVSSHL